MNSLLRRILEKSFRNRTLKRWLGVGGQNCPLYVSPDAQLKYLKMGNKAFDADLLALVEKYVVVDSVVWDVGGNVGVFGFASAAMARKGSVVIFEPDTWLVGVLKKTAALPFYRDRDVRIIPCALSDKTGLARFMIAERGRASNALECAQGRSQMGGVRQYDWVPTCSMDEALQFLPPPHIVKIDVEGAEHLVISGANEVLLAVRPIFYIEIGSESWEQIFAIFRAANYVACDASTGTELNEYQMNTLFVPSEKRKP